MTVHITPRRFTGTIKIPASKSHTIRQLLIAALADGVSEIKNPLDSLDTRSCLSVCKAFGAEITEYQDNKIIDHRITRIVTNEDKIGIKDSRSFASFVDPKAIWKIKGNNRFKTPCDSVSARGEPQPSVSVSVPVVKNSPINVGNSGTTLFFALAIAGLQSEWIEFTGDEQIQKRSAAPLLDALAGLGVQSQSKNGCVPIKIKGPWKGGRVTLPCPTSQYLSALLIASVLAPAGTITEINVPLLNEKPYIEMTLSYLKSQDISFNAAPDYSRFVIPGGFSYKAFSNSVPGDFSSAAFPAAATVISGGQVTLLGLDPEDTQGDKYFFEILKKMGCEIKEQRIKNKEQKEEWAFTVFRDGDLHGGTFDLNETPDLLPAVAAVAAFAKGDTALVNVNHARIKETDRIAVMAKELFKLGVSCTELPDGLIVHGKGGDLPEKKDIVIDSHGDHRIVMAFAAAALGCKNPVEITSAESVAVTYPEFFDLLKEQELS